MAFYTQNHHHHHLILLCKSLTYSANMQEGKLHQQNEEN